MIESETIKKDGPTLSNFLSCSAESDLSCCGVKKSTCAPPSLRMVAKSFLRCSSSSSSETLQPWNIRREGRELT